MAEQSRGSGEWTGLEVAVIGMAGCFPGAGSVEELWRNLRDGVEAISSFTRDELLEAGALVVTTREAHGVRRAGRLTAADLVPLWEPGQTAYVCGSAGFAEAASQLLVEFGVPASDVRVERFGPS